MSKEIENPQAFPMCNELGEINEYGMTLRDYFAAKFIQGWSANNNFIPNVGNMDYSVKQSYKIADAMLKQRTKN